MADIDPGMNGVTRVGRLPVGINGKRKYGGWDVRLAEWRPGRAISVDRLIRRYGLDLGAVEGERQYVSGGWVKHMADEEDPYLELFGSLGMLLGRVERYGDGRKISLLCPWVDSHSDRAATGSVYSLGGGSERHHGHCLDKGWDAVRDWLEEQHGVDTDVLDWKLKQLEWKLGGR